MGLIDDEAFARAVAEHAFGTKKQGRRAVATKLAAAGVAAEASAAVVEESVGARRARAEELAAARAGRMRGRGPDKAFARLYVVLVSAAAIAPEVAREAARRALCTWRRRGLSLASPEVRPYRGGHDRRTPRGNRTDTTTYTERLRRT